MKTFVQYITEAKHTPKVGDWVRHNILPKTGKVTAVTDTHATVAWEHSNGKVTSEKHFMLMPINRAVDIARDKADADRAADERAREDEDND